MGGEREAYLGGTVPTSGNVFGHEAGSSLAVHVGIHLETSRESKIANLEFAVGIDEQVARFEVAMEYVSRVNVFETAQRLVDEGLVVSVGERLA